MQIIGVHYYNKSRIENMIWRTQWLKSAQKCRMSFFAYSYFFRFFPSVSNVWIFTSKMANYETLNIDFWHENSNIFSL